MCAKHRAQPHDEHAHIPGWLIFGLSLARLFHAHSGTDGLTVGRTKSGHNSTFFFEKCAKKFNQWGQSALSPKL